MAMMMMAMVMMAMVMMAMVVMKALARIMKRKNPHKLERKTRFDGFCNLCHPDFAYWHFCR